MVEQQCLLSALLMALCFSQSGFAQHRVGADDEQARAQAVIVDNQPLLHTRQIFPVDAEGNALAANDVAAQTKAVLDKLAEIIYVSESSLNDVVKLNLYVRDELDVPTIAREINARWQEENLPAVMWVQTPLPLANARLAVDAVAIAHLNDSLTEVVRAEIKGDHTAPVSDWTILPTGRAVYIAGQAEPGKTLAEATTKTLESLHRTLAFMELGDQHVVQIKTFLNPMSQVKEVDEAIVEFYKSRSLPPVSHVEWSSKGAIEIEMIAYVPADHQAIPADDPVVYLTPTRMTSSPVFSRIAVINSTRKIYISGLTARTDGDGDHEVRDIFAQLSDTLHNSQSSLRHLVKATYYVSGNDSSTQLNALRPMYYDPKRPPSASKAPVQGVGFRARTLSIDLIAVPAE
ncbi:MAG: Rid family hydrolase [Planctomycetaceae bacterium]